MKHAEDKVLKLLFQEDTERFEEIVQLKKICENRNIPYEINSNAIQKIAHKDNTYVIGIFEKYNEDLDSDENHIVLVEPRNPGNTGAIMRTMLSFGYKNLAVIRDAVDIFDPKIVRSSMGAFFHVRKRYYSDISHYVEQFGERELLSLMVEGSTSIAEIRVDKPFSIILGNESRGLDKSYYNFTTPICIPQSGLIDSLNISIASAIAMWELRKR
jgi:TrmH family RNA methyltransferase